MHLTQNGAPHLRAEGQVEVDKKNCDGELFSIETLHYNIGCILSGP